MVKLTRQEKEHFKRLVLDYFIQGFAINLSVCEGIHAITAKIGMYKNFNARITKLQERAKLSNLRHMLKKLLLDIDNLEKFYTDMEYKNKLESARYLYSEYFELERIYEQEKKIKEKLNLPQNCTIRYEKVKCCKDCKHHTHKYYYAYTWDSTSKKLKKKYIGKQLPLPTTI